MMERTKKETYLASLNNALHELMAQNEKIIILGEDILDPYGGAFKVTKGLSTKYPDRIVTTPISEAGIVGIGAGLALRGMLPIVEIMFGDFLMLAGDQIMNHIAKFKWMYNGQIEVPIVIRTPMGGRRGYGPTHSQCLEKHFLGIPGLTVVSPSIIGNPGTLLKTAVLDNHDPVLFVEDKTSYSVTMIDGINGWIKEKFCDEHAPFPTYYFSEDSGTQSDGILFCYGGMVSHCLAAIEHLKAEEGLRIRLVVCEQISPIPPHVKEIMKKFKPSYCFYAEEASILNGWGSELIATIEEIGLEWPIEHLRLGSLLRSLVPSGFKLEKQTLLQAENIVQGILSKY